MLAQNSGKIVYPPIILGLLLAIVILVKYNLIFLLSAFLLLGTGLFMAWFFRDPVREIKTDPVLIYAAADGKVIYTKESNNEIKIAIRMSPFNVHINRAPIEGNLTNIEHSPGKHRNVYFGDAEEKNERNLIVIESRDMICEVLQLTGAFARRIEVWCEKGKSVLQGEKIGIIRFGSQTNVRIQLRDENKRFVVLCKSGDKVEAGLSVLAEVK